MFSAIWAWVGALSGWGITWLVVTCVIIGLAVFLTLVLWQDLNSTEARWILIAIALSPLWPLAAAALPFIPFIKLFVTAMGKDDY